MTKINSILTFYWPIILLDIAYVSKSTFPIGPIFFPTKILLSKILRNNVIYLLYKRFYFPYLYQNFEPAKSFTIFFLISIHIQDWASVQWLMANKNSWRTSLWLKKMLYWLKLSIFWNFLIQMIITNNPFWYHYHHVQF